MRCRRVREQPFTVKHEQFVHTVGQYLFLHNTLNTRSGNNGMQFRTEFICQFAALCEQFLRYFLYLGTLYFTIYKNVVHIFFLIGVKCSYGELVSSPRDGSTLNPGTQPEPFRFRKRFCCMINHNNKSVSFLPN